MLVQVRAVPKHRSTHISNYQTTERESYKCDETSLTTIPMCPRERFALYKSLSRLFLSYTKDWATLLHLVTFVTCYPLQITLSQNYLLPIISVLAENTLIRLQRIYNFLLLHAILSSVLDVIGLYYPLLYYFWD